MKAAEPARQLNTKFEELEEILESVIPKVSESMASNNWVIHGKHTSTGMPILASDPHLPNQIPSVWTLNELVWGENRLTGATMPGIPLIGIGKGKQISFG